MQQGGAGEPGHQRGVFHRVPEPPASPAQFIIGPVGAHRDAERQAHPSEQGPGSHPTRPRRIDAALDQRCNGKRKGDGETDITQIEHRRMHRETEILQDRIEVAAFQRSLGEPPKRGGGKEDEKIKRGCDPGLHRQHVGLERSRQIDAERCDQGAEQRQDQHPQQHRAFVIAPNAGELIDQRHLRMRILVNIDHREIRRHITKRQRGERQHHKGKLRQRGGVGEFH